MIKNFCISILFFLFCQSFVFAYIKQNDEYSCGAVSGYNLINTVCPKCRNNSVETLKILMNTNTQGTTSKNLCKGLKSYFKTQNIQADIAYYGIKKVQRYKKGNEISVKQMKKYLSNGYSAIINIGIYKKSDEYYIRQYGHYVNLISIEENNTLKIFDPYDKNDNFYWKLKKQKCNLKNINDNEAYTKETSGIFISTPIEYLEENESAVINGIFYVKIKTN